MGTPLLLAVGIGVLALLRPRSHRSDFVGVSLCGTDPPPPDGLKVLRGIASPDLQSWASAIVNDPKSGFGQTFEKDFGDKTVTARVEHHTWTTHGRQVIQGCFKGVTLYEPLQPDNGSYAPTAIAGEDADDDIPPSDDKVFFPLGDGEWCGFPSGEILEAEDIPFEGIDDGVPVASTMYTAPGYGTGQLVDGVSQEEAFDAAAQLTSMFPNVRALVAQAPDGFYVRVITLGGGMGQPGFGGLGNLFGPKGLRRQPAGRGGDGWGEAMRLLNRLPSQIGRVRIQIDRLVSPDFAVAGIASES